LYAARVLRGGWLRMCDGGGGDAERWVLAECCVTRMSVRLED
jgi:alpha-D-ribose 1-methylphosphonate 5-triphosphate synthase subunit PhnG